MALWASAGLAAPLCLSFLQPREGLDWGVSQQFWQKAGRAPPQLPFYSWEPAPSTTNEDTVVPPQAEGKVPREIPQILIPEPVGA